MTYDSVLVEVRTWGFELSEIDLARLFVDR